VSRPRLLFISPRFLFPTHSGGAIRTAQILRGMKGRRFHIKLLSPGSKELERAHRDELSEVADEWSLWPAINSEDRPRFSKLHHLLSPLPLTVAADRSREAAELVRKEFSTEPDVVVADFVHSAVLLPAEVVTPLVVFTHNCEAEIYERHAKNDPKSWMRLVWRNQAAKMIRFEREALKRATSVVAVSERDAQRFEQSYGVPRVQFIPTGVDLERFRWEEPKGLKRIVFTGSMDSAANIDGVEWLLDEIWPRVQERVPEARMIIVGKSPPGSLVRKALGVKGAELTGRVPDIVPYLAGADAFVIPLRVGGGTRMKVYEAMAAGVPVVSTSIGVEGLGLEAERHFLAADTSEAFAEAVIRLILDRSLGCQLSRQARTFLDMQAPSTSAARRFEQICFDAMGRA
jgi:glycosyltransferase involved in cell wall biosynthesis